MRSRLTVMNFLLYTFRIDKSSYKIKALIFIFQEVKQTTRINAFFYAIFSSF